MSPKNLVISFEVLPILGSDRSTDPTITALTSPADSSFFRYKMRGLDEFWCEPGLGDDTTD